jgi:3-hydroxy-3-methylglutaryl CoA synthase
MAGIKSYGAYIPIHRLARAEIAKSWGLHEVPGEKAVASYDEDSLTMAIAAARECMKGIDPGDIHAVYFASTTAPYREKQAAAFIATVLGLNREAFTVDFSGSIRGGTNALRAALDAVKGGSCRSVLVCAADVRLGHPMGQSEMAFGDGAAALLISGHETIAEIEGSYTLHNEIQDVWRSDRDLFVRMGEDRFVLEEGYGRVVQETISGALEIFGQKPDDFSRVCLNAPNPRIHNKVAQRLRFDTKTQLENTLHTGVGDTGTAMPLMSLVAALEDGKAGSRILLAGYGNGCDVFSLRVTGEIEKTRNRRGIRGHLRSKKIMSHYNKYLLWRELVDIEPPPRPPKELRQPTPAAQWRENQGELRLNGTRCTHCGTPQYPPQRVCMNCKSKDEYEYYAFADRAARVFSFSHDYVMETQDPPVTITVVDFEGGGRIMCDMTDREPQEVKVGMTVEMTFRRLYYVGGIYNYWWKCMPMRGLGEKGKE